MTEPDFSKKPPVVPLTPAEEAKRFWLPPGFKLEPVLSDPDIEEPAQIAFDGNGRMFVLELRGYMQDADASGELDPVGRISVHEDRDGNLPQAEPVEIKIGHRESRAARVQKAANKVVKVIPPDMRIDRRSIGIHLSMIAKTLR